MAILVNCPACRHVRQVPDREVCLGVMCPYCHDAYMDAVDRPLGGYAQGFRPTLSSSSYDVDMGQWFRYAVAHWSAIIGPTIGFLLIQILITIGVEIFAIIPFVGLLLVLPLAVFVLIPLGAGMNIVCLAQLKGDRWTFGDFFAGFSRRWIWKLIGYNVLLGLLVDLILAPAYALAVVGAVAKVDEVLMLAVAAFFLVFGPLAVYVSIRIGFFGQYLILDRDFGPVEAMQESWDLTTGHFWGLLGVAAVLGLIGTAGYLACGIGLLFALPLIELVRAAGYLMAGGTRPPMKEPDID